MPTRKQILMGDGGYARLDRLYLLSLLSYACYRSQTPLIAANLGSYAGYTAGGFVLTPGNTIPNYIAGHDATTAVFAFCGTNAMNQLLESCVYSGVVAPVEFAPAEVHSFFDWCAWSVWPQVAAVLQSLVPPVQAVFTGHSLGGVTALLVAARAAALYAGQFSCVTFGGPKAGNLAFVNNCVSRLTNLTEVRNEFDGVPLLPPDLSFNIPSLALPSPIHVPLFEFKPASDPWILRDRPLSIRQKGRSDADSNLSQALQSLQTGEGFKANPETPYVGRHSIAKYARNLYGLSRSLFTLDEAEFLGSIRSTLDGTPWAWVTEGPPPEQPGIPDPRLFLPGAPPVAPFPAPLPPPPADPLPVRTTSVDTVVTQPILPATGVVVGATSIYDAGYGSAVDLAAEAGDFPRANYLFTKSDRGLIATAVRLMNGIEGRDWIIGEGVPTAKVSVRALVLDGAEPGLLEAWEMVKAHLVTLLGIEKISA